MDNLHKKKVLVIAGDFVEDYELLIFYQTLLMVGHDVHVISPNKKKGDLIKTSIFEFEGDQTFTEKRGHVFEINYDFDSVDPQDYDALYIPGGKSPGHLRMNKRVLEITRHFIETNKLIGTFCSGIKLLTATNQIKGRKVTCYAQHSFEVILAGAEYQESLEEAVVDGNLVTAQDFTGQPNFMRLFLEKLGTTFKTA